MFRQLKPFEQAKGGTRPLYCLQNVRLGYGIASLYPNAITAWEHTQQHKNRDIPKGLDIPLFYSYKKDGHVNVRIRDGRVWSDGEIFKSLEDYEARREPVYLGWGESINNVKVIVEEPDVPKQLTSDEILRIGHGFVGGWNIEKCLNGDYDKQFREAAGWKDPTTFLVEQLIASPAWKQKLIDLQNGKKDEYIKVNDLYIKKG